MKRKTPAAAPCVTDIPLHGNIAYQSYNDEDEPADDRSYESYNDEDEPADDRSYESYNDEDEPADDRSYERLDEPQWLR